MVKKRINTILEATAVITDEVIEDESAAALADDDADQDDVDSGQDDFGDENTL